LNSKVESQTFFCINAKFNGLKKTLHVSSRLVGLSHKQGAWARYPPPNLGCGPWATLIQLLVDVLRGNTGVNWSIPTQKSDVFQLSQRQRQFHNRDTDVYCTCIVCLMWRCIGPWRRWTVNPLDCKGTSIVT